MPKAKSTKKTYSDFKSSNLESFTHDTKKNSLIVTFHNGKEWKYKDVPRELIEEMAAADSVGKFFIEHIRDTFEFRKLG